MSTYTVAVLLLACSAVSFTDAYIFGRRPIPPPRRDNSVKIPTLARRLQLTSLVSAWEKAGLISALNGRGPFTVFSPNNLAFQKHQDKSKSANVGAVVLKSHILTKNVASTVLSNDLILKTMEGQSIRINRYKGKRVVTAQCAPLDLKRVDQRASNGVIHVLNAVMIPPAGNIVNFLSRNSEYKTLSRLIRGTELESKLSGPGPFTLFAPTEKAFAKVSRVVFYGLIKNPLELEKFLEKHIVPGTHCNAGLESGSLKSADGKSIKVTVSGGKTTVNDANIVDVDISVTNGVVHGIDTVLLPHSLPLPPRITI